MTDARTQPSPGVPVEVLNGVTPPDGLLDAFWSYERALMTDDLAALDRLFAPGPDTLRGDASGLLVGHDAIRSFRAARGGAPKRAITSVHVRPIDADNATIVALTRTPAGGRGQQTQVWHRDAEGWVVTVAHVSPPVAAISTTVWRVTGAPLVEPAGEGPLSGETLAVKDVFRVVGQRLGAGVREYLAESELVEATAAPVQTLLDAGASITGIAQTDQFAYSIAGTNPQYGTPPNPEVPGGISGGSSSGPASAVALGQASIGVGTDTGGSIRVPASYQGLWGLRTTHGAVSRDGVLPLAPSFDTVGWLTRDARTLTAVARICLSAAGQRGVEARYVVSPALSALADPDVREAFEATTSGIEAEPIDFGPIDELFSIFRTVQAAEAWRAHGAWVSTHPGILAPDVASRFDWASTITPEHEHVLRARLSEARLAIRRELGERILLVPSASTIAPQTTADAEAIERTRAGTLRMTCIAGLGGLPALSVPALRVNAAPVGLCMVGPRFTELALLGHAAAFAGPATAAFPS